MSLLLPLSSNGWRRFFVIHSLQFYMLLFIPYWALYLWSCILPLVVSYREGFLYFNLPLCPTHYLSICTCLSFSILFMYDSSFGNTIQTSFLYLYLSMLLPVTFLHAPVYPSHVSLYMPSHLSLSLYDSNGLSFLNSVPISCYPLSL